MNVTIKHLAFGSPEYAALSQSRHEHLLYTSVDYLRFLERLLPDSQTMVLGAFDNGRLAAALPCFIHEHRQLGTVINSLPFFGSHGGVLLAPETAGPEALTRTLLREFKALAEETGAVAATIVSNPLMPNERVYDEETGHSFRGNRIGQMAPLPRYEADQAALDEALMASFHSKTRNMVRKAQRQHLETVVDNTEQGMRLTWELHTETMRAMGSNAAKPWAVFQAIMECLTPGEGYDVLAARHDGEPVAALLMLYGNMTAEYFVPATREGYRDMQPMSLLVFEAMARSAKRGMHRFNFGGTWESQHGVYRFKKRFGAQDMPYHHYTILRDPSLLDHSAQQLQDAFPFYFTVPFESLSGTDGP